MPFHISPNGSAGGCFPVYAVPGGIKPLTRTIFDPTYFGGILRNHVFYISPTRLKFSIMGNYLDFALKIAHRGNTGSYRGKRKLPSLSENYICALLPFFSVLVLWHKEKSASLARGKHVEAALSIFSMIPLAGDMAGAVKVGKNFKKISDLPKKLEQNIYKKTTTGASKKQLTSEQINELQQREIQKLEFEASKRCLGNTCFPGGTIVHTKNGQIPIEQIEVGTWIYAQNVETGEADYQKVISISKSKVRKLFHIYLENMEIKSTAMHRLYVYKKGFVTAQDLVTGDQLVYIKDGKQKQIPIDQITIEFYKTPVEVYNFEVDNWYTYMIGELGILVHNGKKTCSGKIPKPSEEENLFLDLLGYYDAKKVITDIGRGEVDLDTLKAGASLIPAGKVIKLPKVIKAIGNVGKTGSKKGKEGEKISKSGQVKQTKAKNKGRRETVDINNPVLDNIRTGSALKGDSLHAFNDIIDNYAGDATKFSLTGGDGIERTLYQIGGSLNGKKGIFEWIVDPDPTKGVTHRRFIEGVEITGKPNARP